MTLVTMLTFECMALIIKYNLFFLLELSLQLPWLLAIYCVGRTVGWITFVRVVRILILKIWELTEQAIKFAQSVSANLVYDCATPRHN